MLKKLMITTFSIAALAGASLANAAQYDFIQWEIDNAERGFSTFTMADDLLGPLVLTATAWHYPIGLPGDTTNSSSPAFVYLDGRGDAGMGVCSVLTSGNQCNPSSDDNVSWDISGQEVLSWEFGVGISEVKLVLGAHNHTILAEGTKIGYRDGNDPAKWRTAEVGASGMLTLSLSGDYSNVRFRALGSTSADQFYIRSADVKAVPIPAAAWLFGSALIGLAGVARKRKLS